MVDEIEAAAKSSDDMHDRHYSSWEERCQRLDNLYLQLSAENARLISALEKIKDALEREYGWNGTWLNCNVSRFEDEPFLYDTDCTKNEQSDCGSQQFGGCTACKCWHAASNALDAKRKDV